MNFKYSLIITTFVLFLIFLPFIWKIDFMQNDDWNRYLTVDLFLHGDFKLLAVTATTFYTQGLLGMAFAKIFSIERLPVLTLIFGCLNFYLFAKICNEFFKLNKTKSILTALILFFNPIHFYSLLGFMTEVYLLSFSLLSIYFYYKFLRDNKISQFILANLFWILGFFAKQWAIVFPAAIVIRQAINKKWKSALIQLLIIVAVVGYYFIFFPKTGEMSDKKEFEFANFVSLKYIWLQIYSYFIYLTIFALPFVAYFIYLQLKSFKDRISVATVLIFGLIFAFFIKFLSIKWFPLAQDFPMYPNVFTDRGFFLILGEGSAPNNIYTVLINNCDDIGLICLCIFLLIALLKRRSNLGFEISSILIGLGLIIGTPGVFDRYLLVFVPVAILAILKLNDYKISTAVLCIFLAIQALISIDYGIEYINRQKLIWDTAEAIHQEQGIPENKISAGHAWGKYYNVDGKKVIYMFKYPNGFKPEFEEIVDRLNSKGIFINTEVLVTKLK
jgi:hypothetical protein